MRRQKRKIMNKMQEFLKPDEKYNQSVDADIEREGQLDWAIRILEEQLIECLVQKEWYAEADYVLFRLDDICSEYRMALVMNREHQFVRSLRLFE